LGRARILRGADYRYVNLGFFYVRFSDEMGDFPDRIE